MCVMLAYLDAMCLLDNYGITPLMEAAEQGCEAIVGILIQAGANVQQKDLWSETTQSTQSSVYTPARKFELKRSIV
jgi:ankyrin repeat protein